MSDLLQGLSKEEREKARATSMPDWVDPMLAKLTHSYFSSEDWIFEQKLDGERVIAYVEPDGEVRLMSRNKKHINDSYPEIEEGLAQQALAGCILDGEVVALDADNVSDFQKLQPRMQASSRQESEESGVKVYYYIFDCMYIAGHDITACALLSRKELLKAGVDWHDPLRWTSHRNKDGLDYYREACQKGWEGLIAKLVLSPYIHGRSGNWLKFKCRMQQEFVICGFTDPEGKRVGFGALLLGFYRGSDLVYAGKVGTGFDDKTLEDLHEQLEPLERATSPYDKGEPEKKGVHFVAPEMVCEVAFAEWTADDRLRHPRYKGLRRDKDPRDVHKEDESERADL